MKRVEKRSSKPSAKGRRRSKDDGYRKKRVKSKTTVVDVKVEDIHDEVQQPSCGLPDIHEDRIHSSDSPSDTSDPYAGVRSLEELRKHPDAPEVDEKTAQVMAFLRGKEEALRWDFKMEDPELEDIRLRLYKLNRRKRYMAHAQKMGYSWANSTPTGYASGSDLTGAVSSRDSSAGEKVMMEKADSEGRFIGPYVRKEELQHYMSVKEAMTQGYPVKRSNLLACNYS